MKKAISLILVLVLCLSLCACGGATTEPNDEIATEQETTVEIVEAPAGPPEAAESEPFSFGTESYSIELPIYELVKRSNIAGAYIYSDFVFNEKGQLIEKKESGNSNGIITYEYDDKGRVISETDTSSYGYEKTEYTYNDKNLILRTKSTSDFSISDGSVSEYEYVLDDAGNIIKETVTFPEYPNEPLIFEYEYDKKGVLIQETETWYEGSAIYSQYIISKEYDSAGRLIREYVYDVIEQENFDKPNTFEYAVVGSHSISSENDPTLLSKSQWQSFPEIEEIPLPHFCIADIAFETKQDNGTAIIYTFILPNSQDDANTTYYKYQSILADVCGFTLDNSSDMVYISKDGELLGLMMAGNDSEYGFFLQISFPSNSQESADEAPAAPAPAMPSSSFSNKYGTATTRCVKDGCDNYIAPSGDTNSCILHSNNCLNCGCYIDGDAMYCMSCLSGSIVGSNESYDYDKGYGYSAPKDGQSFSDYVKEQDPDLYDAITDNYNSVVGNNSTSSNNYDYDKGYGYSAPKEGQSFSDYVKEQDPELYDSLFN